MLTIHSPAAPAYRPSHRSVKRDPKNRKTDDRHAVAARDSVSAGIRRSDAQEVVNWSLSIGNI